MKIELNNLERISILLVLFYLECTDYCESKEFIVSMRENLIMSADEKSALASLFKKLSGVS